MLHLIFVGWDPQRFVRIQYICLCTILHGNAAAYLLIWNTHGMTNKIAEQVLWLVYIYTFMNKLFEADKLLNIFMPIYVHAGSRRTMAPLKF